MKVMFIQKKKKREERKVVNRERKWKNMRDSSIQRETENITIYVSKKSAFEIRTQNSFNI